MQRDAQPRHSSFKARRSLRLSGYDYRLAGVYFVTLCTYQKAMLFGEVDDGDLKLNALGEIVRDEWRLIANIRSNVKLDLFVVMPNHFHGLVIIDNFQGSDLTECMSVPASKESHTLQSGSLGAVIGQFKLAVGRQARRRQLRQRQPIWQRNYYDHIVRDEETLNDIRQYIVANPARWREDSLNVN